MRILLCVSLILLSSDKPHSQSSQIIETEKIKGIICANNDQWGFMFNGEGFWTPTKAQVLKAEEEIERYLKNKPPARSPGLWRDLPQYKRQYVGFIVNNRKKIFCNFYCSKESLTCAPKFVMDGGDCYFQVEYDVGRRKITKLEINGEA